MVKEWSRNSQGHLEFKILIFFLQNEIEDALGRILNTINRYLHAKMIVYFHNVRQYFGNHLCEVQNITIHEPLTQE